MAHPLQRQHEIAVCNRLLKNLALDATFVRLGDDSSEPDVIYSLGGESLGIEVATAYYDDSQAERQWSLARGKIPPSKSRLVTIWRGDNFDEKIYERIQSEILDKCSRSYSGVSRVWLCIDQQAALSGESEVVKRCVERLAIPKTHGFDRIFLHYQATSDEGGNWQSIQLNSA
jgi:hypothetical protein